MVLQSAEVTQPRDAESSSAEAAAQEDEVSKNFKLSLLLVSESQNHGLKPTLL